MTINWKCIPKDKKSQYQKLAARYVDYFGVPYMFNSIMHYHKYYQIPNCPEFTPKSRSNCKGGPGHHDDALPEDWKMLNKAHCKGSTNKYCDLKDNKL